MGQLLFVMTLGIKSFEPGPGIDWLALVLPCAWSFFVIAGGLSRVWGN